LKQVREMLTEEDTLDPKKPYHQLIENVLTNLKEKRLKNMEESKKGRTEPLQVVFSKPRDMSYTLEKLSSDSVVTFSDIKDLSKLMVSIPLEFRSHIESMQREPINGEKECVNGPRCMGMKIRNVSEGDRFVLTKFYLKTEIEQERLGQKILNPTRACIFCILNSEIENFLFYNVTGKTSKPTSTCQLFRVGGGMAGQYMPANCIWFPQLPNDRYQGLLGSIPIFTTGGYTLEVKGGVRYYVSKFPVPTKEDEEQLVLTSGFRSAPLIANHTMN
jgi:hypothetical protein